VRESEEREEEREIEMFVCEKGRGKTRRDRRLESR
jgi:hypothetical protein